MVVENRAWIFGNWAALRLRNGKLGPKGPKFDMLQIREELLHRFGTQAWMTTKMARFLRWFRDYDSVSLGFWATQLSILAKSHYLSNSFCLKASKFELYFWSNFVKMLLSPKRGLRLMDFNTFGYFYLVLALIGPARFECRIPRLSGCWDACYPVLKASSH